MRIAHLLHPERIAIPAIAVVPIPLLAGLALLAPAAAARQAATLPELADVRACAELEPAEGALVTYPTALPFALLVEIAEDDTLFVLVDDEAQRAQAVRDLRGAGADLSHVDFIPAPTETIWTRDWSAAAGFLGDQHRLVDQIFLAYTLTDPFGGPIVTLPMMHVYDDLTPSYVAAHTRVGHVDFPAYLVGGNIDFDGLGSAFCTQVLLDENQMWGVPPDRFREHMHRYLGVEDLRVLPNYAMFDLQHIDCVLKVLDEETLVITRAPSDHPAYPTIEALAQAARSYRTPFGRPYQIHRIEAPVYDGTGPTGELANYANSLILNGKILIPRFGLPRADEAALRMYSIAMPGYEVSGYLYEDAPLPGPEWAAWDAIHCRTHQIFDPGMIVMKHPRVRSASASDPSHEVLALIRAYSGAGLVAGEVDLFWRTAGAASWNEVPLVSTPGTHGFAASIPSQAAGTVVEYYLSARDGSGRVERKPPLAPQGGAYSFVVQ